VVEDDDVIRQLVSIALQEEGYEVLQAPHGLAALQLVEQAPPDVVLLDMRMPVMDGWEFARAYRQHAPPRGHIVVMTAAVDAIERAGQIGVDTVLAKPFDLDDLLSCVARYAHVGQGSSQWM
jgi:CheY-like chemotaxis protein